MKKIMLLLAVGCMFGYTTMVNAQIKVSNGGNVGIGLTGSTNAQSKLEVNGATTLKGLTKIQNKTLIVSDPNYMSPLGSISLLPSTTFQVNGRTSLFGQVGIYIESAEAIEDLDGYMQEGVALQVRGGTSLHGITQIHSGGGYFEFGKVTERIPNILYRIHPTFLPSEDGLAYIGTPERRFRAIHIGYSNSITSYQVSDKTMKKNIKQTDKEKSRQLSKVKVYTYDMDEKLYKSIEDAEYKKALLEEGRNQTGIMAQELMEIFPELVKQDDGTGLYSVNYIGLIPHIINELQAQNELIEQKDKEIEELKNQMLYMQLNCCNTSVIKDSDKGISTGKKANTKSGNNTTLAARLDQNAPNPFKDETRISFYVPENSRNAGIYIYNLLGSQIKKIDISQTGEGFVVINGSQLAAGIYIYALIIDNEMIDSKKMVLTE